MLALAPHLVDMARAEASPALGHEAPGPLTPSDIEFAELQPLRQLWRSDAGHARPRARSLLAAMLDDLNEQATAFIARSAPATATPRRSVSR